MQELIYNNFGLQEEQVDDTIIRTKALMINSKNEILLGYSYKTYQFPGGHLKEGETIFGCLQREIKEETGIFIKDSLSPFLKRTEYHQNYLNNNKNCKIINYYYLIYTDELPKKEERKLDEQEKRGNFTLLYIPLEKVDSLLLKSIHANPVNPIIIREMIDVLQHYREYI